MRSKEYQNGYQPKTGAKCTCRKGVQRDNCASCEGTGYRIDFKRVRESKSMTIDLPSYWASYLINGDSSGLQQSEIDQCDKDTKGLGSCVQCTDETWFGQYGGLGCDMLTYTFIR